ncbi:MAG TPA: hypothetical protein VF021_00210 [Longimicrobiales bacterium]
MSKKTVYALAALMAAAIPSVASAQFSIAARAGTLGLGGEAAVAIGSRLAIRGGIGSTALHYDGTFSDKTFTVDLPSSIWNVGVDLYPGLGGFHVSAGLLNRKQFDFTGNYTGSADIGGTTYNGNISLVGNMKNDHETAPYLAIGFGRTTKSGLGVSFDLGAASMGDGRIDFTRVTCTTTSGADCTSQIQQSDIDAEERSVEDDLGYALKVHPILSLSLHFGLGGK